MTASGHSTPTPRLPPRRVLEDASGRRLQRLRWVGRVTALLFLLWLAVMILGGLGVGPAGRLPLAKLLRPSSGPPPVRTVPHPVAPAPSDLVPALPAPEGTAVTTTGASPGKSAAAPGHAKRTKKKTVATTTPRGRSGAAPGRAKKTSTKTPATTPRGKSGTAPGRTKRATAPPATTTVATVPGNGHGKKP